MHEKDPFGDKLKDRERAEEDLYFAKRDRELLDKIRGQNEAVPETAARELARDRCPRCGELLTRRAIERVEIDECPSCRGIWSDADELEDLSRREGESWLGRLFRDSVTRTR